jgi:plasmid stabilization system protein ParE
LPKARASLDEAYDWYENQSPGLSDEFNDEVKAAIDYARKFPTSQPIRYKNTRRVLVKRFPYVVVYRVLNNRLEVVLVYRGNRDPEWWQKQVDETEES